MDEQTTETPSHLLTALEVIASFAKGHLSYEEYKEALLKRYTP